MLIDTHCHLDFPEFDADRKDVIKRAKLQGIDYIINIGSSLEGSKRSVELCQEFENIYAAVGVHPHEADRFDIAKQTELKDLAKSAKVVAIGEIGLDYFKNFSKAENQRPLFQSLIKLAKDLNLPLVIHTRNAEADTLKIIKEFLPLEAVVHCFSGDADFLKECMDLGFFVSFTCNITYKKAQKLRDVLKLVPQDRLMLETDAPYLPPEGMRGTRCEPAYIKNLAEAVAGIKGISFEEVVGATTGNAKRFFKI